MTIADCPHGMPSPRSCVECMADGPVEPPTGEPGRPGDVVSVAEAVAWTDALYDGRCAADRDHPIDRGDRIALVADVGWCCTGCCPEPEDEPVHRIVDTEWS